MAECNENSDKKTDTVENKVERSCFQFYSESNFTKEGDLKSPKAFVATILKCDDAKWSSPRAEEKLIQKLFRVQHKMAQPDERKTADHKG